MYYYVILKILKECQLHYLYNINICFRPCKFNIALLIYSLDKSCSCPPAPTNVSKNCSGSNEVTAYSRLYYKCNSGYHVVGDEYRTCHPSGNWTGSDPVCKKGDL